MTASRRCFRCLIVAVCVFLCSSLALEWWMSDHRAAVSLAGCSIVEPPADQWFRRNVTADADYDTTRALGRRDGHHYYAGDFADLPPLRLASVEYAEPRVFLRLHCAHGPHAWYTIVNEKETTRAPPMLDRSTATQVRADARVQLPDMRQSTSLDVFCYDQWDRLVRQRVFVVKRREAIARGVAARRRRAGLSGKRKLNVLLLLIDSLGNAHYEREFVRTQRYLNSRNASSETFAFRKHHVTGWHSDQNQPSLFVGSRSVVQEFVYLQYVRSFFNVGGTRDAAAFQCDDLLWSRFAKHGYLTAHADCYCNKDGMLGYGNAVASSSCRGRNVEDLLDVRLPQTHCCAKSRDGTSDRHRMCAWNNFELARALSRVYPEQPLFLSMYMNELHGVRAGAYARLIDERLAASLRNIESMLDDTVLVMVSDHGLHFGRHFETLEGQIEHKLPLLRITAPKWWLEQHAELAESLRSNADTLTHHYDVYATLEHLLSIERHGAREQPVAAASVTDPLSRYYLSQPMPTRWPGRLRAATWLGRLFDNGGSVAHSARNSSLPPLEGQRATTARSLFTALPKQRDCASIGRPLSMCVCTNEGWRKMSSGAWSAVQTRAQEENQARSALKSGSFANLQGTGLHASDMHWLASIATERANDQLARECERLQPRAITSLRTRSWNKGSVPAGMLFAMSIETTSGTHIGAQLWMRAFGAFVWPVAFTGDVDVVSIEAQCVRPALHNRTTTTTTNSALTDFYLRHRLQEASLQRFKVDSAQAWLIPESSVSSVGCVQDQMPNRVMDVYVGIVNGPKACLQHCLARRMAFAGVQVRAECWCSRASPFKVAKRANSEDECEWCADSNINNNINSNINSNINRNININIHSNADGTKYRCGAKLRVSVYQFQLNAIDARAVRIGACVADFDAAHWRDTKETGHTATTCAFKCATPHIAIAFRGACFCADSEPSARAPGKCAVDNSCPQWTAFPCAQDGNSTQLFVVAKE